MKRLAKILSLLTVLSLTLITFFMTTTAYAAHGDTSAQELFEHWESSGYPDDIGGVYYDSDTGMMSFLIVNPAPQRINELRAMLSEEALFTPCVYSYNELRLAQKEIDSIMGSDNGIYSTGVGWTSKGGNVRGFGESSKEFRLIIGVDVSVYDHYREGFTSLYGNRVIVEASEQVVLTDDSLGSDAIGDISGVDAAEAGRNPIVPVDISVALAGSAFFAATSAPDNSYWLWVVLGIGVLVSLLLFLWLRTHPVPAMQIANGTTVIESGRLSIKQVKALVKDSSDAPRSDLFDSIIHKINITKGEYTK